MVSRSGAGVVALLAVGVLALVTVVALASGVGSPDPVRPTAPTPVDGCTTIAEPGRYVLASDVVRGGGTRISHACIRITTSDVVLDGDGHRLEGLGVSNTTGIAVEGEVHRVSVHDVNLTRWNRGLDMGCAVGGAVANVTAVHNAYGLYLVDATRVHVVGVTLTENVVGLETTPLNRVTMAETRRNAATGVARRPPSWGQVRAWLGDGDGGSCGG